MSTVTRCTTCGRFRRSEPDDRFCRVCGSEGLEASCACGRDYGWVLDEAETAELHCPRCGARVRGRSLEFE